MSRLAMARAGAPSVRASSRRPSARRAPVLLLTHSGDYGPVDRVAEALDRRGVRSHRVDTDGFPTRLALEVTFGRGRRRTWLHDGAALVDLDLVPAVWVRRLWPGTAAAPSGRAVDFDASRAALVDTLRLLRHARFVNPLDAEARAESKLLQLEEARALGLATPPTLVTNSAGAALTFSAAPRRTITKLLTPAAVSMGAAPGFVFTHEPTPEDLEGLARRPQLFQPLVEKVRDWRVVVVGRRCFAASLDARSSPTGHLDWRRVQPRDGLDWREERLPAEVRAKVLRLASRLGLTYAALDFLELQGRRLCFLEVNPGGEYGWLESELGLPISDAIAEALTRGLP